MANGESPGEGKPGSEPERDLDALVLESLLRLNSGNLDEFADHVWPPSSADSPGDLEHWIDHASKQEICGLLFAVLRRWHELRNVP